MTKTCELCPVLYGPDEPASARLGDALDAWREPWRTSAAIARAIRIDGAWFDAADVSFHKLYRGRGWLAKAYNSHRHYVCGA